MTRRQRYSLILGLLTLAALVALSWLVVKTWFPT